MEDFFCNLRFYESKSGKLRNFASVRPGPKCRPVAIHYYCDLGDLGVPFAVPERKWSSLAKGTSQKCDRWHLGSVVDES